MVKFYSYVIEKQEAAAAEAQSDIKDAEDCVHLTKYQ